MSPKCISTKRIINTKRNRVVVFCDRVKGHKGKHRFLVRWTDEESTQ